MTLIRSKAPLRLGLAGGGTDVSPYSDEFGGAILNATISLHTYATLKPTFNNKITFVAAERNERFSCDSTDYIDPTGDLVLHKGIYNRIVKEFTHQPLSFELTTYSDAPAGSGLGTSSTLVVAIIGAFVEWLKLPLGEYDIARLAFEIERQDLKMAGGKQDQYAATFGGVNFMEFQANDNVIVNPLRINSTFLDELEHNLVLYYTETSRASANIIEKQSANVVAKQSKPIEAMHHLKEQAYMMKEALLKGQLDDIGRILDFGWNHKKKMAEGISNELIDSIYDNCIQAGALGGKISGAGGGGFMIFYCPENTKHQVIEVLNKLGGSTKTYTFTNEGLTTWTTQS